MAGVSLLVPCLNEADSLPALVARVRATLDGSPETVPSGWELILIDDGSRDATWDCIARLRRDFPALRAVRHPQTSGIPAAWRTGVAEARGDCLCVLDADLQYEPEQIPRLLRAYRAGDADIVQGVRAAAARPRDHRYLLSRGLSGVLNLTFGMSARDNKSGFFVCGRDVLADLLAFSGRYRHWQCFVMVAAHHRGYRIREIETPFRARRAGRSAFGTLALGPALGVAMDLLTALREYPPVRR
jgi:phenylacetate-CoA ligase